MRKNYLTIIVSFFAKRVQHLEGMCLEVKFIPLSILPELLFDKFLIHESQIVIILLILIYSFVLSICYIDKV